MQLQKTSNRQLPKIVRQTYSFNMASPKTTILLSLPFMIIGFLLSRAPYNMVTLPPNKVWADGPMKLITTPQFQTKKVLSSQHT